MGSKELIIKRTKMTLSHDERLVIVTLKDVGMSFTEIASYLKRNESSIRTFYKSYLLRGNLERKPGSGSAMKTSPQDRAAVIRLVKKIPNIKLDEIKANLPFLKICKESIRKIIVGSDLFKSTLTKLAPFISNINRKKRNKFCNEYISKSDQFWRSIIWSDVSIFTLHNHSK